jgi:isoquinoline 1-oxidoreductase/isoquinoline 1-oxidoreductase beta subunit
MNLDHSSNRRQFLLGSGLIGTSLLVGCRSMQGSLSDGLAAKAPIRELNAWVRISSNSRVALIVDKVEMGQGVTTLFVGMAMDGLGVPAEMIDFSFAPAEEIYVNRKIFARTLNISLNLQLQFTGYSTSTVDAWETLQGAIMGARAKLLAAAAQRWKRSGTQGLVLADGKVLETDGDKRQLTFGEIVQEAAALDIKKLSLEALQPRAMRGMSRVDQKDKVTGEAMFGIDVTAAVMGVSKLRYAVLVRPEEIGASLQVSNAQELSRMPGYFAAFPILRNTAFAVVADRYWQARKIAKAVRFETRSGPNRNTSSETIIQDYLKILNRKKIGVRTPVDLGWGAPEKIALSQDKHDAEYILPYLPHSTMEPMNASCALIEGVWTIWVPTQFPEAAQAAAAKVLGVRERSVKIESTLIGGGFGRRLAVDYVTLVAAISKELDSLKGAEASAVKMVWSREDDFQYDVFRPIACHKIAASLDGKGISAWKQEIATQSIIAAASEDIMSSWIPDKIKNNTLVGIVSQIGRSTLNLANLDPLAVEGAADSDYKLGRFALNAVSFPPGSTPGIPVGYWRSVGHSHSCFAIESFIDELARKFNKDEIALRRSALQESPRSLAVMERCLALSRYSRTKGPEGAMGFARHHGWGSYIAMVIQIDLDAQEKIQVKRVWAVVDVGFALQPDIIRQQIEGGIIFGLSGALKQEVVIEQGKVRERNFHDSGDVLRLHESPEITVDIIDQGPQIKPTGVGELGVPCVAPALANALHSLSGKRVRRLPLTAERIRSTVMLFLLLFAGFFLQPEAKAQTSAFKDGAAAFQYLFSVAMSPRCVNCHGAVDKLTQIHFPMVGEQGQRHAMNIDARFPKLGGDCTSCHQKSNFDQPRYPPGAFNPQLPDFFWHMPPTSMILATIRSPRELCELWTDPNRNAKEPGSKGGINNLPLFRREFQIHASQDPLVAWAFQPGPGRAPAPGSKELLVQAMDSWIRWLEEGNRCQELP